MLHIITVSCGWKRQLNLLFAQKASALPAPFAPTNTNTFPAIGESTWGFPICNLSPCSVQPKQMLIFHLSITQTWSHVLLFTFPVGSSLKFEQFHRLSGQEPHVDWIEPEKIPHYRNRHLTICSRPQSFQVLHYLLFDTIIRSLCLL